MVCNGHYHTPAYPTLKGLETFSGTQIHSHDYRNSNRFKGMYLYKCIFGTTNSYNKFFTTQMRLFLSLEPGRVAWIYVMKFQKWQIGLLSATICLKLRERFSIQKLIRSLTCCTLTVTQFISKTTLAKNIRSYFIALAINMRFRFCLSIVEST